MLGAVNLGEKFAMFSEHWSPRIVARQGEVHLLLIEPSGTPNTGDTATAFKLVEI